MKIALVVYALETGGVESFLRSLHGHFTAAGHEVRFVETTTRGDCADGLRRAGCCVWSLTPRPYESKCRHVRRLAKLLAGYDVLLLNDAPLAQSVLGLLPQSAVVVPVLHTALPSMVRNATANSAQWDVVVTVSAGLEERLVKDEGLPESRVRHIANGVRVPPDWPKRNVSPGQPGPLKVVYLGRIEHAQKGVLLLPDILVATEFCGADVEFHVIGDGPDLTELRQRFGAACPGLNVQFHGRLDHAATLSVLSGMDVLLMPSRFEGHPIVLLEGMAAGVVPVASRLPGHTDYVVSHRESGYLCEVDDVRAFGAALREAAFDRRQLRRMSEAAWRQVAAEFSSARMAERYLALIDEARATRSAAAPRRSGVVDVSLLGDLPYLPLALVRPVRKMLRLAGLWDRTGAGGVQA